MNQARARELGAARDGAGAWFGVDVTLGQWAAAIPALQKLLLAPTPRGSSLLLGSV